jgi:hypothetical protein
LPRPRLIISVLLLRGVHSVHADVYTVVRSRRLMASSGSGDLDEIRSIGSDTM